MSAPASVTREAPAAYELLDGRGAPLAAGEGEAVVSDEGVAVGTVAVSWLDVDAVHAGDHALTLELWPAGRLLLTKLGRRFDTFAAALGTARTRARLAGLLAHGTDTPAVFEGSIVEPGPERPVQLFVYGTHLAVAPENEDPFQVPYGGMTACRLEGPGHVVCEGPGGVVRLGRLGRQGDAFLHELEARRGALARRYTEATGTPVFRDGTGVPRTELPRFGRLLGDFTAPERAETAHAIITAAERAGEVPRFGLVTLLDVDGETHAPPRPLPDDVAAFLLAPCGGGRVVLELLAGPSAATYLFEGDVDQINRDLQALHFRRAPLALSEAEATIDPTNPHRLALRRLAPLQRLRAATRGRVIHNEAWQECFERELSG